MGVEHSTIELNYFIDSIIEHVREKKVSLGIIRRASLSWIGVRDYSIKVCEDLFLHLIFSNRRVCHQFCMEDIRKATNNLDNKLLLVEDTNDFWLYKGCVEYNGTSDYTITIKRGNPTKKKNEEDSTRSYMVKEIEVLCQLRHPNIISLIGFCDNENEIIAVYEYMANGSLDDYLTNRNNQPLSWKKRLEICIGVARALHYLHSGVKRVIIHRLINSSYILLDNNMMPKHAYFGHSLQGPLSTSKPKPIIDVLQGTTTHSFTYITRKRLPDVNQVVDHTLPTLRPHKQTQPLSGSRCDIRQKGQGFVGQEGQYVCKPTLRKEHD
ncbi:receptor-like protein kinase THESEUS 1 [Arachis duranensis]|uniref:Receptor-like protein kinase THESEUS 1 n=1 Tax=Arachis duranensis TaxID=130453 RepID=A0A9C6TX19_ARADU|nr:receptor-like protein kinase THESEUS 1 [Arachis duranensis]